MRSVWIPFVITVASIPGPVSSASAGEAEKPSVMSASTNTIAIDVVVEDGKGGFVMDLTRSELEIYEDGKRVDLQRFELCSSSREAALPIQRASTASDTPQPRRFILVADLLNSSVEAILRIQPDLKRFVREVLGPSDQTMIAIISPDRRLLMLAPFTSDRVKLLRAIDALEGNADLEEPGGATRLGGGQSLSEIERMKNKALERSRVGYEHTATALKGLTALVERVARADWVPGPNVVYVAERLELYPGRQFIDVVNDQVEDYNRYADSASGGRAHPLMVKEDLKPALQAAVSQLNRRVVTIYSIEALPGSKQESEALDDKDALRELAEGTGGRAYLNHSAVDAAFRSIEQDTRLRYVLAYEPPNRDKKSAKWRTIKVKCTRPGVKVRHRAGYLG